MKYFNMCEQGKQIIKEEKSVKKWLMANIIVLIVGIFTLGSWVQGVEKDLASLEEKLELRTEDRFYVQDGLILEQRIIALENNYQRIEAVLIRLDNKIN